MVEVEETDLRAVDEELAGLAVGMYHPPLPALQRELLQPPGEGRRQVCHASAELGVDRGGESAPMRHAPELVANRSHPGVSHAEAVESGEGRRSHRHTRLPSGIDPGPAIQEQT